MIKEGNFVKIKDGIELELNERTDNWGGQIVEVYPEHKTCRIKLDSITLKSLSDQYLLDSIEKGEDPYEYIFEMNDLEKYKRRDTENEFVLSLDDLSFRMSNLEDHDSDYDERFRGRWIKEFERSQYFHQLDDYQKETSGFIIDTFLDYMYNYEDVVPNEWSPENIREVCLNIVPKKISTDQKLFENYGDVLIQFLKYFEETNYISTTKKLRNCLIKIKDKIPEKAKNPNNWGMAKSMVMSASDSGIDITDQNQMDEFLIKQNRELSKGLKLKGNAPIPKKQNQFNDIGRNQKITVKYDDGKMMIDIKFKKVEHDLLNGICELIKN